MRETKEEKKEFYRKLFALVLPLALQNLMTALVSASDALMLGMLDQSSLSSVSLATQVQFVLNLFYAALTIGTTVLAAQYWGKGDREAVERVLAIVLKSSMVISLVFFLAAFFCPHLLMRIFTNDPELIQLGIPYLRIVSWSYLFMGISQIYLCIMKNSGRTMRSTVYGSSAVVLNLLLNTLLIFGFLGFPRMEIAGAALATTIARAVELGLVLMENLRKGQMTSQSFPRSLRGLFFSPFLYSGTKSFGKFSVNIFPAVDQAGHNDHILRVSHFRPGKFSVKKVKISHFYYLVSFCDDPAVPDQRLFLVAGNDQSFSDYQHIFFTPHCSCFYP